MWPYISSEKNCSSLFIKATAVCDRNQFGNVGSNKTYAYKILKYSDSVLTFLSGEEFNEPPNFLHDTSLKLFITYAAQKSWKNDFLPTLATLSLA